MNYFVAYSITADDTEFGDNFLLSGESEQDAKLLAWAYVKNLAVDAAACEVYDLRPVTDSTEWGVLQKYVSAPIIWGDVADQWGCTPEEASVRAHNEMEYQKIHSVVQAKIDYDKCAPGYRRWAITIAGKEYQVGVGKRRDGWEWFPMGADGKATTQYPKQLKEFADLAVEHLNNTATL